MGREETAVGINRWHVFSALWEVVAALAKLSPFYQVKMSSVDMARSDVLTLRDCCMSQYEAWMFRQISHIDGRVDLDAIMGRAFSGLYLIRLEEFE